MEKKEPERGDNKGYSKKRVKKMDEKGVFTQW